MNNTEIKNAITLLRQAQINTDQGMPKELFLLISGLIPLPNVDLLIVNEKKQILLAWRQDEFFENSWHIPGGCMRYGENFETCLQNTAKRELGTNVLYDKEPLAVRNVIRGINTQQCYPRERGHNVAILFRCYLSNTNDIPRQPINKILQNGSLKWFNKLPANFMRIQHVYDDILQPWI